MTHTPGPWKPSLFNIVTNVTGLIQEKPKATPLKVDKGLLEILDDNESTVAFVNLEDTSLSKKDLANANLIAAAPELLAALRELLYVTEPTFDNRHEREAAIDAINKATGEVN